jgi:hypothetical protein
MSNVGISARTSRLPRPSQSLAVVGAQYPNKRGPTRRFELNICQPGEPVELRPEPKNPADEHAIAVYSCRGIQLGYLTAERAPWIGGMLKRGREVQAIFHRQTHFGAWLRIAFDGEAPALPPAGQIDIVPIDYEADFEPDFHPDEEWPN